jgi:hypothetical protein
MRGTAELVLVSCSLTLLSLTALSIGALGNPITPQPGPDTTFKLMDPAMGVATLFLLNIVVNLFFLTGFLFLVARRFRDDLGRIPRKGWVFLVSVLALATVVTMIGAIVDYYLVMGIDPSYDSQARVMVMNLENWAWALTFIFLSIALASFALLRLALVPGIVLGALFIPINLIWWVLSGHFGWNFAFLNILFSVVALPILTKGLLVFHQETLSGGKLARTDNYLPPVESAVIRR